MSEMTLHPRPAAGAPRAWTFPVPQRSQLANGLNVLTVHRPGQQVIACELLLDSPLDAEPVDGVSTIMSRAFTEGTETMDAETFAFELERSGATLDASAEYGGVQLSLDVPVSRLERGLGLLADAVRAPAFPAQEIDRLVRQRLDEITHELASPGRRAAFALYGSLFDAALRVSRPRAGTADTVKGITRAQVTDFFAAHVRPSTATLVVVGDLDGADLDGALERTLGLWQGTPGTPSVGVRDTGDDHARVIIVDRPGSVQTQLLLGRPGPDRHDPVWAPLSVGTYCLGGTLTSRLDRVLREEKGYTYGVRAMGQTLRSGGLFAISGSVETDVTGPAVADLFEVLRTLAAEGLTEAERDAAVQNLVGTAPLEFQTSRAVCEAVSEVVADRLPDDYLPGLYTALAATTTKEAARTVVDEFDPAHLVVVAVGDASKIRGPLEELGIGPVTVRQ